MPLVSRAPAFGCWLGWVYGRRPWTGPPSRRTRARGTPWNMRTCCSHDNPIQTAMSGTEAKAIGLWRALAPCVTCPHPETDRLEAKQLRMCLLFKTGCDTKTKAKKAPACIGPCGPIRNRWISRRGKKVHQRRRQVPIRRPCFD